MPEAVINYATYRNSNYSWMLGRFVVTAARLGEFYESAGDFISRDAATAWRVSVIVGDNVYETLRQVEDFNAANGPGIVVDTVEIKADDRVLIEDAANNLPPGVTAYFELALDETMPDLIATLALNGQRAKIRTGGVTPEAFPATPDIIRFVRACLAANVPFKATAGLHHPIRCFRPLTYENNSPKGTMHGFLNLFLMTGFAREGYRQSLLEDVMEEEFDEVFRLRTRRPSGVTIFRSPSGSSNARGNSAYSRSAHAHSTSPCPICKSWEFYNREIREICERFLILIFSCFRDFRGL